MPATISAFEKNGKSYPIIELRPVHKEGEKPWKYGFSFGLTRARLILENYEAIREFVEDNTGAQEGS